MAIPIHFNTPVPSPPPTPRLSTLRTYISELIFLARSTINSQRSGLASNPLLNTYTYFHLRNRINDFFVGHLGFDFYAASAYYDIVEMRTLLGLVERVLREPHIGVRWPEMEVGGEEKERVEKRANEAVEISVFGEEGWWVLEGVEGAVEGVDMGALEPEAEALEVDMGALEVETATL